MDFQAPKLEPVDGPALLRTKGVRQGNRVMDDKLGRLSGVPISARLFDRSGKPRWGLVLLVSFTGNIVLATVAWLLVGLLIG